MPARLIVALGLMLAAWTMPALAQAKKEADCLDVIDKYLKVLGDTLKEAKPSGACALAKHAKDRHEEILRMYKTEPEDCRASALGKNLDKTLKARVSQEARMVKRHCRQR
jgi:hypothetical protein